MAQQLSPWLEGAYGWSFGEGGWNSGMDSNLLKFSFMFDRNVDSITAALPAAVSGQAHYLTTDNRLYFAVGTTYFSTPVPKWFNISVRGSGDIWQFNGTSLVQIDSPQQLDSRIDSVELTVSTLGTAAFQNTEFFAEQSELDVAIANASNYTDTLRQDMADPLQGAELVARSNSETVGTALDRAGEANQHAFGNVKKNTADYATLGANIAPALASFVKVNFDGAGAHTAGTVGTMIGAVVGDPFSHYLLTITVTTSTTGRVQIRKDGADIFGDLGQGYLFSTATVLLEGNENNRDIDATTFTFLVESSAAGFSDISFTTDTAWAGSITGITLQEVAATKFVVAGASAETNGEQNPAGLKVGAYNRNDLAVGDKFTLGAFQYDGLSPTPAHNVAFGSRALASNQRGDQNSAFGAFTLAYNETSNNSAFGYSSLKFNTKGRENSAFGYKCFVSNTTGYRNAGFGFWASALTTTGKEITAIGYYAGKNADNGDNNTYIGARAGLMNLNGNSNTFLGSLAGFGTGVGLHAFNFSTCISPESWVYGDLGVAVGYQARVGTSGTSNSGGVAIGANSTATVVGAGVPSTAVGNTAQATGDRATAIGQGTKALAEQTVALGGLAEANANFATSLGAQAGRNHTGLSNTFLGNRAGNNLVSAATNCTLVGANSEITGSNQVQLGNSATTTYAYGAVQDRSDKRDKADIEETELGIEFITGLRAVSGRWDMRDDYRIANDDGTVTVFDKDGSKKRNRRHQWFIAQEVEELCGKLGVDFGGLQHHAKSGGDDVYSLGYSEFIPPIVKAVQQCWSRLDDLEARLSVIESKY